MTWHFFSNAPAVAVLAVTALVLRLPVIKTIATAARAADAANISLLWTWKDDTKQRGNARVKSAMTMSLNFW